MRDIYNRQKKLSDWIESVNRDRIGQIDGYLEICRIYDRQCKRDTLDYSLHNSVDFHEKFLCANHLEMQTRKIFVHLTERPHLGQKAYRIFCEV